MHIFYEIDTDPVTYPIDAHWRRRSTSTLSHIPHGQTWVPHLLIHTYISHTTRNILNKNTKKNIELLYWLISQTFNNKNACQGEQTKDRLTCTRYLQSSLTPHHMTLFHSMFPQAIKLKLWNPTLWARAFWLIAFQSNFFFSIWFHSCTTDNYARHSKIIMGIQWRYHSTFAHQLLIWDVPTLITNQVLLQAYIAIKYYLAVSTI